MMIVQLVVTCKGCGKKWLYPSLKEHLGMCPESEETLLNLIQNSWHHSQNSNQVPAEYKSEILQFEPTA
jgi:hypothetical protein